MFLDLYHRRNPQHSFSICVVCKKRIRPLHFPSFSSYSLPSRPFLNSLFDDYLNIECRNVISECGANDGTRNHRINWSNAEKTCPIASLPNTNLAWASPGSNPLPVTMWRWRLTARAITRSLPSSVNARNPTVLESPKAFNVQHKTGFKSWN
jgi:hypothetical protein